MILRALQISLFFFSVIAISQSTVGLKAYYPFNGNANDESGFNNNGILDNPVLTTDRFEEANKAYLFNGNDDVIRVLDNDQSHLVNDFTIMAWINPSSIKSQTIIRKGSAQSAIPSAGAYNLALSATNVYVFSVGTTTETIQVTHPGYPINEWQLIIGVKEGNTLSLYINGIKVNEELIAGTMAYDTSLFLIGTRTMQPANTFDGKIDEVRLYDRALGESEIQDILSILEIDLVSSINIYPNPFSESINIQNLNTLNNNASYQLFSINGQLIKQDKLILNQKIETTYLPRGIYFLKINDGVKTFVKKMIKS